MFQIEVVRRDENGYWFHSKVTPSNVEEIEQLPEAKNMELIFISMEGNVSKERYQKYLNETDNISDWNPYVNEPENRFLLGIYKTEFGPEACFDRQII